MIWLVPETTGVEISAILKDNANLLQLQATIALVLVVVPRWTLHTVEKATDSWSMGTDSAPPAVLMCNFTGNKI